MAFSIGEIVRSKGGERQDRLEGVVKHITCVGATGSGGKTCDRNTCNHNPKDRVWVKWPDGGLCSYQLHELEVDIDGEEEVLNSMEDLLDDEAVAFDAASVVKTILKARRTRATAPSTKEVKMSSVGSNKSIMEMIKADATNAAYRVAARQINNGIRSGIVDMLKSKGANSSQIEGVAMFLETEWGAAILGTIAGHGLGYIPGIKDDPRVKRLAGEFRVSSMTTVGNEIFEAALNQIVPVITGALNTLPAENNVVQNMEEHKSATKEMEIEVETDLSILEGYLEKEEEKRMVLSGKS